jgi:hypothetical protein
VVGYGVVPPSASHSSRDGASVEFG